MLLHISVSMSVADVFVIKIARASFEHRLVLMSQDDHHDTLFLCDALGHGGLHNVVASLHA